MGGTLRLYGKHNAIVSSKNSGVHYGSVPIFLPDGGDSSNDYLLQAFDTVPDEARFLKINAIRIFFCAAKVDYAGVIPAAVYPLNAKFDQESVTYATAPSYDFSNFLQQSPIEPVVNTYREIAYATDLREFNRNPVLKIINNGVRMSGEFSVSYYTDSGAYPPYVELDYGDPVGVRASFLNVYGSEVPQSTDFSVSWSVEPLGLVYADIVPVSSVFMWRCEDEAEWHEIPIDGSAKRIVLPAGAFPAGDILIRVVVTTNSGDVATSNTSKITVIPVEVVGASPAAGLYVPKFQENVFRWGLQQRMNADGTTVDIAQQSAIFRWRETGSADVHTISVGAETQVTVPAGTFTADSIDWQVAATTVHGVVATSAWYTCTTVEAQSSARAISPKSTAVDGSAPVTFRWEHIIPTGTAQTAFELETSPDSAQWQALASAETAETTYTAPAGTFGGGDLYWRVRTRNTDGVFGEWSEPAYCLVLLVPPTPAISVESAAPRFAIRWAQEGQEAFEVALNGVVVARSFGRNAYYRHADFLSDGNYMVGVRVQNKYGLWSGIGTVSVAIRNETTQRVALQAVSLGTETELSWSLPAPYSRALVYRNGVLIADKVGLSGMVDYFAPETAMYQVRAAVPDGAAGDNGMYAQSDIVTVTSPIPCLMITAVDQPLWLKIATADTSLRKVTDTMRRDVGYVNSVAGGLPTAAIGTNISNGLRVPCAFRVHDVASALALESLLGQIVCVRSPHIAPAFYVLEQLARTQNVFLRSYTLTLTQVSYDEVIR